MIGLASDKDNSFFRIETPDDPTTAASIKNQHVLGLTVVEEESAIPTGTVRLMDPEGTYSKVLRRGQQFKVFWGYKRSGVDPLAIAGFDFFGQAVDRRGFNAFVQDVSGEADDKGVQTVDVSFLARDFKGFDESKIYNGPTKGDVIRAVFAEINVLVTHIDFPNMSDQIIPDGERRDETQFRYLARKSMEWKAIFRIGYTKEGTLAGIFISADKLEQSTVAQEITGGGTVALKYASGADGNVISYRWQNVEGENGVGDNVQMQWVNGGWQFVHQKADTEDVTIWRLNEDRIAAEMGTSDHLEDAFNYFMNVLKANKFSDDAIKRLFDPVQTTTAPNGFGYTVNVKMFGTPFATPPAVVNFIAGFPPCLMRAGEDSIDVPGGGVGQQALGGLASNALSALGWNAAPSMAAQAKKTANVFYVRKVTHTLGVEGYFCDVEVVDSFIMYGALGLM